MDNDVDERGLRGVGRKLSPQSADGARLEGMLHSVFGTMVGASPYRWLFDYLEACARRPKALLPWGADERRPWDPSLPLGP